MDRVYFLDGKATLISIDSFADERGTLCAIEFPIDGFTPVRAFSVNGTTGAVRGEHGHKNTRQLFMLISGEIEIELRYMGRHETINMDTNSHFLLLERGIWAKQTYLQANTSLMVFCDLQYDRADYFT